MSDSEAQLIGLELLFQRNKQPADFTVYVPLQSCQGNTQISKRKSTSSFHRCFHLLDQWTKQLWVLLGLLFVLLCLGFFFPSELLSICSRVWGTSISSSWSLISRIMRAQWFSTPRSPVGSHWRAVLCALQSIAPSYQVSCPRGTVMSISNILVGKWCRWCWRNRTLCTTERSSTLGSLSTKFLSHPMPCSEK